MTDIHSHVLPGVDDGAPDMKTSLSLLRYMESLGIQKVWLTPHVMEDYHTSPEQLRKGFAALKEVYRDNLELDLASEYMMDAAFTDRLKGDLLPIGSNNLLVETSYMFPPTRLQDILMNVWNAGYHPLIAHPERYLYMEEQDYGILKEKGYYFQLNLMSLSGYYGHRPKMVSEKLLLQGMYDFVGTDLHHLERYQPMLDALKLTRKQLEALEILITNNAQI
ncbi:MAG: hypothetical protein Q4D36_02505 [Bacteroidales bacterium]|nr:hypothetical protein [Bacteroidales bacterium]